MDLKTLIKESHQIAKDHGWHDEPVSFENRIVNIHCELSEAWEDYRNNRGLDEIYYECKRSGCFKCIHDRDGYCSRELDGCDDRKTCGIPIELADVVIRICDYFGSTNADTENLGVLSINRVYVDSLASLINACHSLLERSNDEVFVDACDCLNTVICAIEQFCRFHNIDLDRAIELKTAYNKTRPHRHGGKRA